MLRTLGHPYLLLALTAALWGANAVAGKLALGHISPMMLTFLRWLIAAAILVPFAWPRLKADWPIIRRHAVFLFLLGACGMSLFNGVLYSALTYTSAVQVTIVQSGMPLVVFAGMYLFFGARVLPLQLLGFALTAAGVLITAARGDLSTLLALDLNRGDALMVLALLLYGGYTVALRAKPALHWLSLLAVVCVSALVTAVPMAAIEIAAGGVVWPDGEGIAIAAFTAIFPSIIAQQLYIRGVETIGANRANLFINLVPIFGAALAVLVLREALHPYHLAALVLVLSGIGLAELANRRGRQAPASSPSES